MVLTTRCGYCGVLAVMTPRSGPCARVDENGLDEYQAAFTCAACTGINIATTHIIDNAALAGRYRLDPNSLDDIEYCLWQDCTWTPKFGERSEFSDVPAHIAGAASEATLCLSMGAYRAVGSLARAVVEATAKDKNAEGSRLIDRINALEINALVRDQAHEVRYFGNDMAHGDFTEQPTEEEAAEIVELMRAVLNEVYQTPARLKRRKELRESRKLKQVSATQSAD